MPLPTPAWLALAVLIVYTHKRTPTPSGGDFSNFLDPKLGCLDVETKAQSQARNRTCAGRVGRSEK